MPAIVRVTDDEVIKQLDILHEVSEIVARAALSAAVDQGHRAEACGCRGCKAQARETEEWLDDILDAA